MVTERPFINTYIGVGVRVWVLRVYRRVGERCSDFNHVKRGLENGGKLGGVLFGVPDFKEGVDVCIKLADVDDARVNLWIGVLVEDDAGVNSGRPELGPRAGESAVHVSAHPGDRGERFYQGEPKQGHVCDPQNGEDRDGEHIAVDGAVVAELVRKVDAQRGDGDQNDGEHCVNCVGSWHEKRHVRQVGDRVDQLDENDEGRGKNWSVKQKLGDGERGQLARKLNDFPEEHPRLVAEVEEPDKGLEARRVAGFLATCFDERKPGNGQDADDVGGKRKDGQREEPHPIPREALLGGVCNEIMLPIRSLKAVEKLERRLREKDKERDHRRGRQDGEGTRKRVGREDAEECP